MCIAITENCHILHRLYILQHRNSTPLYGSALMVVLRRLRSSSAGLSGRIDDFVTKIQRVYCLKFRNGNSLVAHVEIS